MRLPSRSSLREEKKSLYGAHRAAPITAGVAGLDAAEPEVVCAPVGEVAVAALAAWLAGSTYAVAVIVPVS